ncbi:MAG: O-methyltransferase [Leptospiraceae bacterium]|nr:O-methyltransferase [Leptospiraceae bacterium]MCK6379658.1 O-methyltransferase [Leptospiraceae bacterium]NUM40112.1 O-methyltransferase [Leptospiraceae bacterium]
MKKESIFIEGLESFINGELIKRPSEVFQKIENIAIEKKFPILSPMSGHVLSFLVKEFSPKKILELGTGLGYSILWIMSSGIKLEKIRTLDRSIESLDYAKKFLKEGSLHFEKIEFILDWAVEFLKKSPEIATDSDFIFVDCDKVFYPEILKELMNTCKKGTSIVFDNVLWHGRVMNRTLNKNSDLAIQQFWTDIKKSDWKSTLFPAGDGLLLLRLE